MQPLANGAQIIHRRHIHRVTERRSASVANDLDRFVKTDFVAIGHDDFGLDGGEAAGEFAPQAATGTGDENSFLANGGHGICPIGLEGHRLQPAISAYPS